MRRWARFSTERLQTSTVDAGSHRLRLKINWTGSRKAQLAGGGEAAVDTLSASAVATWVGRQAGVVVDGPRCATYIGYAGEGPGLGVHLDKPGFGAVNLLVCLRRERDASPRHRPSTTFFFTPGVGLECFDMRPGDCLVFDGTRIPHGRSPLQTGDEITLLSVGFAQG